MLDHVVSATVVIPDTNLTPELVVADVADLLDCDPATVSVTLGGEASIVVVMASGEEGTCHLVDGEFTPDTSFIDGVARTALMGALGQL